VKQHYDVTVCAWCMEPVRELTQVEVSWCEACQAVEPDTVHVPCPCDECEAERKPRLEIVQRRDV
jgi:hypothetical protein